MDSMAQPLRVLSIGHSYVVAMNRAILREIAEDGDFEVTIGAPKKFHGTLRTIEMENEPLHSKVHLRGLDAYMTHKMHIFAYNQFQLKRLIKEDFDVLHIWEEPYIFAGFQIARLAHKFKLPFCVRTAQSLIKKYPQPFATFERNVFEWSEKWIAGGQLVYRAMEKKGWDNNGKGNILTLAVDTERFKPFSEEEKQNVRTMLGFEKPVIGFLGRLTEEKGSEVLMKAMSQLKDLPWSLFIMGSGPYEDKIKKWIEDEGLQDRVVMRLYSHEHIPSVLPVCDLLLCPSQTREFWKEQFGRMIVEAFAAGVPVIGSDSGEIPFVVGDAGKIVPEANVDRWVEAISEVISDQNQRSEMAKKGIERCHQYSAKSLAERYKDFYRSLIGK